MKEESTVFKRIIYPVVLIMVGVILGTALQPLSYFQTFAQPGCQTFKETGKVVCSRFLDYWQKNGGLAQQGYPISNEFTEKNDLDGKTYLVQYFERAVFEYHPEISDPKYQVLLSQLGTFQFKRKYPNGDPSGTGQPTPPPVGTTPTVPSASAIEVKGSGQRVSDPVNLKQGLAVFRSIHTSGSSNFIVELVDTSGKSVDLLANEIGPSDEWTATRIPSDGQYLLKVKADGNWTISITQPKGAYSPPPPMQEFRGHGSFVTSFFSLKSGAVRIKASHTAGTSNFIVELLDQQGKNVELIANEIGPSNIDTIENIPANGAFILAIKADGDWDITLQQ